MTLKQTLLKQIEKDILKAAIARDYTSVAYLVEYYYTTKEES